MFYAVNEHTHFLINHRVTVGPCAITGSRV